MRFTQTGRVVNGLYVCGNSAMPVYLLDGPQPVLFDAGLTAYGPQYIRDVNAILDGRRPAWLFLTHSHYDHVGSVAQLKEAWPEMKIAAAAGVGRIMTRDNAVSLIGGLNREVPRVLEDWGLPPETDQAFRPFELDRALSGEEEIELGPNRILRTLPSPGHTRDFTAYWLPEEGVLIGSEAVGCDEGDGRIMTEFLVDYDMYRTSLTRLAGLDAEVLCQGHHLIFTGPDVRRHTENSLDQAEEYLFLVEKCLAESGGEVERAAELVKAAEWDPRPYPKQPEAAYRLNAAARVKTIRERMIRRKHQAAQGWHSAT